ncbi:MAG: NADH-quinone oxidoreductase subunit J [Chloroflexi bacterium]|nr:NADH-quinone oxidoreductase subunit J [Chloroflexota bacterium]MQC27482.1 NADH-quinone oxidoreductase subunit J [Chloroflexota bacterium]
MESTGIIVAFWVLAAVTVAGALGVIVSRDLLHAIFFLILSFLGMAGLFITLSADFIAVAQVLIYAGAISVLLVFAVMLTPLVSRDNGNSLYVAPGALAGLGLAALVVFVAVDTEWAQLSGDALAARSFPDTVATIGDLLLGRYVLAFEVASILLLFALLGAIVLVHERRADAAAGAADTPANREEAA